MPRRYRRYRSRYGKKGRYYGKRGRSDTRRFGSSVVRGVGRTAVNAAGGLAGGITYVAGRAISGLLRGLTRR